MPVRIDRVRTNGVFTLDGQSFDVENNIWLVGDDEEVLVLDAAHEAGPIVAGLAGRHVVAIVCTHGHNDHINAALDLRAATGEHRARRFDDDRGRSAPPGRMDCPRSLTSHGTFLPQQEPQE